MCWNKDIYIYQQSVYSGDQTSADKICVLWKYKYSPFWHYPWRKCSPSWQTTLAVIRDVNVSGDCNKYKPVLSSWWLTPGKCW